MSKSSRHRRVRTPLRVKPIVLVTSSILAASAASAAEPGAPAAGSGALEEVIVTAQKTAQNLQDVPISVTAFDNKALEQLQVTSFDGYAKFLPSVSVQSYGPGQAQVYFRGVTNGSDGLHVGSQPLVGIYVDEMPVTTIANNLDIHIYDIERVEALAGPQGTLFGSSSMAGVLRIITNKPDPTHFSAGYDVTANTFTDGAPGGKIEGFVNVPLGDHAAVRLVAFTEHDGGYINNVPSVRSFPTWSGATGETINNDAIAKRHFNSVQTNGGRAALKVDFADNWTVTPSVLTQSQNANNQFAFAPALGDLNVAQYYADKNTDNWYLATLAVQGKISDFDLVYSGGYLQRNIHSLSDYSDYSYYYDAYYHNAYPSAPTYFGDNFRDNNGNLINPAQYVLSTDNFTKQSHELRISTPKSWKVHGVLGLFMQRQYNYTRNEYRVDGLADAYSITNLPGVLYLNSQRRTDRDKAVFTDWTWDVTDKLALTGGIREFAFDNTVYGFFGYNGQPTYDGYTHSSGEQLCFPGTALSGPGIWPCANINNRATKTGTTHRLNVTYKLDPDRMVYATWSTGFRPGGVNRVITRPPYQPDYITNVEAGWKTEWFDRSVRFNGAFFTELWKDMQYAITGQNGITEYTNAGRARIKGVEAELTWKAFDGFTLTLAGTTLDARLVDNACNYASPSLTCTEPLIVYNPDGTIQSQKANSVLAPPGTRLPVSAQNKGDIIARYEWTGNETQYHVQLAVTAQSSVIPALTVTDAQEIGDQPGYANLDLAAGFKHGSWQAELFINNALDNRGQAIRYTECAPATCSLVYVLPIAPRLVGLTVGQKF